VVINVVGKGLVVLTGCGHAGVVNIVRYARRLTGVDRVYAVLGGFHLTGAAVRAPHRRHLPGSQGPRPEVLVPAHCTGWRATQALAARLPEAFIQNSVGTTFELAGGRA
jgi:7,8-dihydropterin-6-yl-methyl-4-(beta-D-ribofuranosyl)aminobenzene 5'-phosphate synthase